MSTWWKNVAQALTEIRPTVMAAVPRVFEKIYSRLMEQGSAAAGVNADILVGHGNRRALRAVALRRSTRKRFAEIAVGAGAINWCTPKSAPATGGRLRIVVIPVARRFQIAGGIFLERGRSIYQATD